MWTILLFGAFGGLLRGVLGIAKDLVTKKDLTINWLWFWITVVIAAILGLITASFFSDDLRVAILGGYSGSDFVEGLMKLKLNQLFAKKPVSEPVQTQPKKYGHLRDLIEAGEKQAAEKS